MKASKYGNAGFRFNRENWERIKEKLAKAAKMRKWSVNVLVEDILEKWEDKGE